LWLKFKTNIVLHSSKLNGISLISLKLKSYSYVTKLIIKFISKFTNKLTKTANSSRVNILFDIFELFNLFRLAFNTLRQVNDDRLSSKCSILFLET
jgi:hypothetical protein